MADVFLCYAGNSGEQTAERIAADLGENRISCWYHKRDMKPDENVGVINRAIQNCRIFLLLWNTDAANSKYVESELALAYRRILNYENCAPVFFRLDDTVLPYLLRQYPCVNGSPTDDDSVREVRNHVERLLNRGRRTAVQYAVENRETG